MSFLSLIHEKNNYFLNSISAMKDNGQPIVLIGAGCLAHMTWDFLKRNNINIDFVAVNQEYLKDELLFKDQTVSALESFMNNENKFNFIYALQFVPCEMISALAPSTIESLIFDPSFIGVNTHEFITYDFCLNNENHFNDVYNSLVDEKSKETFIAYLNQRISAQHKEYKNYYEPNHYFPSDFIRLKNDEVFVDCGAYDGDSVAAFHNALDAQKIGNPKKIFAFEPDLINFEKLIKNVQPYPYCEPLNKGVWCSESLLRFSSGKALSSKISEKEGDEIIELTTIDRVVANDIVTFIKMDVEGSELEALKGAEQTIIRCKPTLAISAYHKPQDLFTLHSYIKSIVPEYQFYLRAHHPLHAFELVLYAIHS